MCGIAGIILKPNTQAPIAEKLRLCSKLLAHRGPDGEGFMLANPLGETPYSDLFTISGKENLNYLPKTKLPENDASASIGFVHRRLAIIDLSEGAHQPMCDLNSKIWITYNGEIYNYKELKHELFNLGYTFLTESDTEVIINSYLHWGEKCVEKFNGMWAFCIYDTEKNLCFASRDRLGVKPFYYTNTPSYLAFSSEQKALIGSGLANPGVNEKALHNYLVNTQLETETQNFFENIQELWPGHHLFFNTRNGELYTKRYYSLYDTISLHNNSLNDDELTERIAITFKNAIQLRLRSDVPVGTCLSGGIDSSAIAVSISELTHKPYHCFTSVFRNTNFNEERFADIVAKKTSAIHHKVQPTYEGFLKDVDDLIYSQDIPIWDTSTYAQYKVMELAKNQGIKVVLDGQGADELFAGYHHHYLATWNHYFSQGQFRKAWKNIQYAGESIPNPFMFFIKERLKQNFNFKINKLSIGLKKDFIESHQVANPSQYFNNLNLQLIHDIYQTRLKSFLKCEDRCGMWHSVESRVPFSDDSELIHLMFSFDGNRKIKNGTSKYYLREALKSQLPKEIYERRDKKGFETPMQDWLKQLKPQMLSEILSSDLNFIQSNQLKKLNHSDPDLNKLLFRLFIYCRWKKRFNS